MQDRLNPEIYKLNAVELAKELIGVILCRNLDGEVLRFRITETEAYLGEKDSACHASKGKTQRTKIMYGSGGYAYIYLCYGIHYLMNIVSGEKDFPQAVLIRGIEGYTGPGKLTKTLKIDKALNGENLMDSDKLWLEDDSFRYGYTKSKRIGIDYATEEYRDKLWRFTAVK